MDLQDGVRLDSSMPEPERYGLSNSGNPSIDMILGGALSSVQQQLERAFRELREKSEELESVLEEAQERNRQLEDQNAELLSELTRARDRAAQLEAAARLSVEQTSTALMTLTGVLSSTGDPTTDASEAPMAGMPETPEAAEEASRADAPTSEADVEEQENPPDDDTQQAENATTAEENGTGAAIPAEQQSGMLSTGGQPGMIHLVASPFDSLAAVLRFQREVKQLPGVTDVKPVEFDDGVLRLAVWYSSEMSHLGALIELAGYDLRLETPAEDAEDACLASSNGAARDLGRRAS